MKTLPITVLVHDGPMARAYLRRMQLAGFRAARLVLMVRGRHAKSGKLIGGWLPGRARTWYAEKAQQAAHNFWPRKIRARSPWLVEAMVRELGQISAVAKELVDSVSGTFSFDDHAEHCERVLVKNLRDPALAAVLRRTDPGLFLFTGGGIVPAGLLEMPAARFLHIHPGHLPDVRGADGLLWSTLIRGRPGASCFFMANGIDTGAVISSADFPAPRFDLSGHERPDDRTLYRAIFSFYDPILRAEQLVSTLAAAGGEPDRLAASPQDVRAGITYHFMHRRLYHQVLKGIFVS